MVIRRAAMVASPTLLDFEQLETPIRLGVNLEAAYFIVVRA